MEDISSYKKVCRQSVIWKSDLTNRIKRSFFPNSGCVDTAIWMHHMDTKRMEKRLDSNHTKMLQTVLNKSWRQHPTKQQLPPIMKTIQIR